jgi:uncharacterized membrane protein
MIKSTVEISRPPDEVFAYLDQLERHSEWQSALQSVKVETEGPTGVGSRAIERRKVPGGARDFTYEITEHDPPWKASFQGLDGPIRPKGTVRIAPLDGKTRSRLTLELELEPVTFGGKLMAPLARRDAARRIPKDQAKLKQILEAGA